MRSNLVLVLAERFRMVPVQVWRNLGTNHTYRWPSAIGYTLGALSVLYSAFTLLFHYNIDLRSVIHLPFHAFFEEQLLPFIASPFIFVGLSLGRVGATLLAASAVGGTILAKAEFRTGMRLSKHVLVQHETGPNFDFETLKNPQIPQPPKHTLRSRALVYVAALALGYSFLGFLAFAAFVPFGLLFFVRDVRYMLTWVGATLLYVPEHLLAPYERWGQDDYWGTRWFLAFFKRRQALDRLLENYYIEFWRVDSLDPAKRHWIAAKNSVKDGARVIALAMWFALISLAIWHFVA